MQWFISYGWQGLLAVEWLLAALAATHVATLVIMTVFGYKREGSFSVALLLGVLFAPVIYAYFFSEWWYHIVICGVAAFVGMLLGTKIYRAKHK